MVSTTSYVEEDCTAENALASKETTMRAPPHAHFWVASSLRYAKMGKLPCRGCHFEFLCRSL